MRCLNKERKVDNWIFENLIEIHVQKTEPNFNILVSDEDGEPVDASFELALKEYGTQVLIDVPQEHDFVTVIMDPYNELMHLHCERAER